MKEQLLLQFWSCSDAPENIRMAIPKGFEHGWIAHLPQELFNDESVMVFFRKEQGATQVVPCADGSGLVIGRFSENAVPAFAWLSDQIASHRPQ